MAVDRGRVVRALGALGALVVGLGWVWALGAAASVAPPPPASPGRIVSVAPSITEALYAVGAGERGVAVADYCARPAAVRDLPRVGGLHLSTLTHQVLVSSLTSPPYGVHVIDVIGWCEHADPSKGGVLISISSDPIEII